MKFERDFLMKNLMGPNAILLLEELLEDIELTPGMRVLDLGCGKGLTSITLAEKCPVQVFTTDLWISATENYQRFQSFQMEQKIIPIHSDALNMPFADEYFDAAVSIDSYHYFGMDEKFMDEKLAPLVKKGGYIGICIPGLKQEFQQYPEEMLLSWTPEALSTIRSGAWWGDLLSRSEKIEILSVKEMQCFDEAWEDWLSSDNEYAVSDRPAMRAGAGKYMNILSIVCRRK